MSPPCLPATEGGARRGLHTGVSLTSLASVLSRLLLGSRPVGDTWCKAVDTVTKGPPLLEGTSAASLVAGCPYRTPGVGTVSSLSAPFPVLSCPHRPRHTRAVFLAPRLSSCASCSQICVPHCLVCLALCRRLSKNRGTEPNWGSKNLMEVN